MDGPLTLAFVATVRLKPACCDSQPTSSKIGGLASPTTPDPGIIKASRAWLRLLLVLIAGAPAMVDVVVVNE